MMAAVGIATALNTALGTALEVRQRSLLRSELQSQLANRMGNPMTKEKLVLEAKANHGIRVEETLLDNPVKDQNGATLQNIKKLTITASVGSQSESASILINDP